MIRALPRYVLISPVKDEERYIELTLQSVISQSLRPIRWVIVDDGSSDKTPAIVQEYARTHSFILLVTARSGGARQTGSAEIHAFNRGHAAIEDDYDFIVKLDGDLSFGPDYFENLLGRFLDDDRLGIASGVYLELDGTASWKPVDMPAYHAFGACKVLRRQCFEDIGGFPPSPGWDTVDEIRALHLGWTTRHFRSLETRHHRPEGSATGLLATSKMHGHIYYVTGGDPSLLLLKVVRRITVAPLLLNSVALLFGYCSACFTRKPRLVSRSEARLYRRLLRQRLWGGTRHTLASSQSELGN